MKRKEFEETKLGQDTRRIYPAWDLSKVEAALDDIARLKPSEIKERRFVQLKSKLFRDILGLSESEAFIEANHLTTVETKRLSHVVNCMWSDRLTEFTFAEVEK
jgi:hypothetical protein